MPAITDGQGGRQSRAPAGRPGRPRVERADFASKIAFIFLRFRAVSCAKRTA
jgi:hypothetical protein